MNMAVLSIIIMIVIAGLMFVDKIPMTTVALLGAIVCCALGMYEFSDIFSGLGSSTAVLMFALSIIGAAMYRSGLANHIANFILKYTGNSEKGVIAGIMLVATLLSSISSNTAVVLMMIPLVTTISQKANISLKKTMYPLGLGAGIGGACTLIGTTANVAGNTVLEDAGLTQMGFWDLAWIGVPLVICSFAFMLTAGYKLLPNDSDGTKGDAAKLRKIEIVEGDRFHTILTAVIVTISIIAMMISTSLLYVSSLIGAVLLVLTGCISEKDALKSVDWNMILLISCFSVISSSISNSGGGELIANGFVNLVGENANAYVICTLLFVITCLITHFMSNVVTVMLMGPIAIHMAEGLGVNPVTMVLIVVVAANACFATPLGSPYFTMLMPVAGYKFKDYVKAGMPYVLINLALAVIIIPLVWKF